MTPARPRINPFHLSGWPRMRPLCPWEEPQHRDYYVPVDRTETAFEEFVTEMADMVTLLRDGRLVLVTGETGCGKSALVNRCADWVVQQMAARKAGCEVLDLTAALNGLPEESIDKRMSTVCDQLFVELTRRQLMRADAVTALEAHREIPRRIYPNLPGATPKPTVLVILLPGCELADEVIRYASLARGRILFFVESPFMQANDVRHIAESMERWGSPITLSVGQLEEGDVRRFASDRLKRHAEKGDYPKMTEDTMESLTGLLTSVSELQRVFHGVYEELLGGSDWPAEVSFADVVKYRFRRVSSGQGTDHEP
jgi:energy-coupling factor transporter ATP-binding protein EcfA2